MESRGPGIYNPLLERCPASPSPLQAYAGPERAVKMSHRVEGAEEGSRAWPGWGWYTASDEPQRHCPS